MPEVDLPDLILSVAARIDLLSGSPDAVTSGYFKGIPSSLEAIFFNWTNGCLASSSSPTSSDFSSSS